MLLLMKAALAFAIAASITWIELVTSKYPRTIRLFWKRWPLWLYAVIYGLISFAFTLAYEPLARSRVIRIEVAGSSTAVEPATYDPSWPIAVMIGLSVRALLHIRLFSVATAGTKDTFPLGTETIVQVFEPWLLDTIALDDYNAVSAYVSRKADKHRNLDAVKKEIRDSLPGNRSQILPDAVRAALLIDIEEASTVQQALESYLRAFGVAAVEQRFPG